MGILAVMQAYTVLSNEATRELYDIDLNESKMEEEMGFTNEALSEWMPMTDPVNARNTDPGETRALFVDEVQLRYHECHLALHTTSMAHSHN